MSDLRSFLQTRIAHTSTQVSQLQARHAALHQEMSQVSQELWKVQKEYAELYRAAQAVGLGNPDNKEEKDFKSGPVPTIKQAVREVLSEAPNGLTSGQILAEINKRYFKNTMERTSLSPQLSRLRREGEATLEGSIWALTQAGIERAIFNAPLFEAGSEQEAPKENEPADVPASSGSDATSVFD